MVVRYMSWMPYVQYYGPMDESIIRWWHDSLHEGLLDQGLTEEEAGSVLAGIHAEAGGVIMDAPKEGRRTTKHELPKHTTT